MFGCKRPAKISFINILAGIMLLLALLPGLAAAAGRTEKVVRVGWYESAFNITEKNGGRSGYAYEYQQKVAAYTGWRYEYVKGRRYELMEMLKRGELDLMTDVSFTEERAQQMLFSNLPMGAETYYFFVSPHNAEIDADNLSTFDGAKVGVNKGSYQKGLLEKWAEQNKVNIRIIEEDQSDRIGHGKVLSGELDAYVTLESATAESLATVPILRLGAADFFFAITQGRPDLKKELDDAMRNIQEENRFYNEQLFKKTMSTSGVNAYLSPGELSWLRQHETIRVGYRDHYLPFCAWDEKTGTTKGMLAEYLNQAARVIKNARLEFETIPFANPEEGLRALERGDIDCYFPLSMSISECEDRNILTTNLLTESEVYVLVKRDELNSFSGIEKPRVAVNSGNLDYLVLLNRLFPQWQVVEFDTTEDGLEGISKGEADCMLILSNRIGPLSRLCDRYRLTPVPTGKKNTISFALRSGNVRLYSIFNKARNMIDDAFVNSVLVANTTVDSKITLLEYIRENMLLFAGLVILALLVLGLLALRSIRSEAAAALALAEKDKLEAINTAKTTFLFNMSHDIRTPMNAILGFSDLIKRDISDRGKILGHLAKIRVSGEYLLDIINNVLDMARIESGEVKLEEEVIELGKAGEGIVYIFEEAMRQKNLHFTSKLDVQHRFIELDHHKMTQIVVNLLSNAVKYTPAGGSVSMTLQELPAAREGYAEYLLTISDTGIGMSEEYQKVIFDSFTRERNTTDSGIEGTGLGMAIVKRLVDILGGTIEVESAVGKGTTFRVRTTHRLVEMPDGASTQQDELATAEEISITGRRILLAEDNELNAEIACAILEDAGLEVERAADGKICVDMLQQAEAGYYDLILMDIQMPNLNGYQATRAIRSLEDSRKAAIPIIAMTANAFDEDKRRASEEGMNGHLSKPVKVDELLLMLKKEISRKGK